MIIMEVNRRPDDAVLDGFPIHIRPLDKHNRSRYLSSVEKAAFKGICDIGPDQIVDCYYDYVFSEGDHINAYDCYCACSKCPHFVGKWRVFNPFRRAEDIFNAETILSVLHDYINDSADAVSRWFVYFITDGEYIKIGKAKNPEKRLGEIQTGNGRPLELLWKIPCKNEKASLALEQRLHVWYGDYQTVGEWFNIKEKLHTSSFDNLWRLNK